MLARAAMSASKHRSRLCHLSAINCTTKEVARAMQDEQQFLLEINWLMDRLRAVEGQLMQVRKTGRRGVG